MGRARGSGRVALVLVVALVVSCSGSDRSGDDAAASRVAKAYASALGTARWADAYAMLLPRQRAGVEYAGLYMFCVQQDDSTGGSGRASAKSVRDAGSVTVPAYRDELPTRVVDVSIRYRSSDTHRGRIRVSELDGHWYVSLADAAWLKYSQGNCPMDAVWEHRYVPIPVDPPAAPPVPVRPDQVPGTAPQGPAPLPQP